MKSHMKRQTVPKNWPIPRKGNKFVLKKTSKGIPILILLRDVLEVCQNRKEVKKAIHTKDILVNSKPVFDEGKSLELFDILTLVPGKKHYQVNLNEKGKYSLEEVKETKTKIAKIVDKKTVKNKKVQINLSDGRNYLSDLKSKVNDSVIIDLEKNKISKVLPLKEKANMIVIGGKHTGAVGKIEKIIPELHMVEVESNKKKFRVLIKQLMVLE
jgi:small subunit ribosomal protein S4e